MTRWHDLDHAHRGFWDEGEESATATATALVATTYTFDPLLDATLLMVSADAVTYGIPMLLDSVFSAVAITATVTLNTGLDGRLEQLISFTDPLTFDGLIEGRQTLKVQSLDSVLKTAGTTLKSVSLDAAISASFTRTTTTTSLDGLLFATITNKTVNFDATALKTVQGTRTNGLDGILLGQVRATSLYDSILIKAIGFNSQIAMDATLLSSLHPLVSLDALLQLQVPATGADAVLVNETTSGTRFTTTNSLDAVLQLSIPAAGADAILN